MKKFKENRPDYYKKYYKKHKKKYIKQVLRWQKEHKEQFLAYQSKKQKEYRKKYPLRQLLKNIKQRCNYPKDKKYKYYGGKGIKCLLIMEDLKYLWFRDKAYNLKQPSIDRKNSDGDYIIKNCRFIEMAENRKKRNKKP